MSARRENDTTTKKNTKSKSPAKKKSEKEISVIFEPIICPLSEKILKKCKIKTCMWHDGEKGCLYRESKSVEELALDKGLTEEQTKSVLRKGKSEITRFFILDRYIEFTKNWYEKNKLPLPLEVAINRSKKLDKILRQSRIYGILKTEFSLSNLIIALLCDQRVYLEYGKSLGIKPPNLVALTGLREIYQGQILSRISKIKTRQGKNNRRKSKKRLGKSKRKQKCQTN